MLVCFAKKGWNLVYLDDVDGSVAGLSADLAIFMVVCPDDFRSTLVRKTVYKVRKMVYKVPIFVYKVPILVFKVPIFVHIAKLPARRMERHTTF
jgi:hypothetical protein